MATNAVKTTIVMPQEFKVEVDALAKELGMSISSFFVNAAQEFKKQKEVERWKKGAEVMSKVYSSDPELRDWTEFEEDFVGY